MCCRCRAMSACSTSRMRSASSLDDAITTRGWRVRVAASLRMTQRMPARYAMVPKVMKVHASRLGPPGAKGRASASVITPTMLCMAPVPPPLLPLRSLAAAATDAEVVVGNILSMRRLDSLAILTPGTVAAAAWSLLRARLAALPPHPPGRRRQLSSPGAASTRSSKRKPMHGVSTRLCSPRLCSAEEW
jgi:hypothetical protein